MTCPVYNNCGGCDYCSVSYAEQLLCKENKVRKLLTDSCEVFPIVGAENPYNYRNKVHLAFGLGKNGHEVLCGRYSVGSHKVTENFNCLIEDKEAQVIIAEIKSLAIKFRIPIYDEKRRTGILRRVLVRVAKATGEYMLVLVSANREFPGKKNFIKEILKRFPEIKTVVLNINSRTDSMILGDKSYVEFGRGFITDELCGLKFRISDKSFYQINHDQTERLYWQATDFAAIKPGERVLDAYCGIGTIGMTVAASNPKVQVQGVELNRTAVTDAEINKKINNLNNISFVCKDATEYMLNAASKGNHYDVVILDPPRSGTTPEFIKACKAASPERIVYVSCNPETLARDLSLFSQSGYFPQKAVPYDLFPMTEHVETVVLLSKLSSAPKLEVKISMSELDLTEAEAKATYDEIQEYVKEQTGLHVTHLNIAQIKRKHGIIERANYNLPKSENSRQPNCPPEKEKAIVAALKHFKMID